MQPRIDFITLAVEDLDRAIAFYRDGLGLPTDGTREGYEDHCLFNLSGTLSLVLYRKKDFIGMTADPSASQRSAGFILSHIAASRTEVDEILSRALRFGAVQIGQPQDEEWGYTVGFSDPDGHQWEITHMTT